MIAQAYEDKESANKHPHAELIAEALKDTSRKIEGKYLDNGWAESNLAHAVNCGESWQFRFADTVKPECISPLTNEELNKIHKGSYSGGEYRRAIANAAHNRAIEDVIKLIAAMPNVTTLTDAEIGRLVTLAPYEGNVNYSRRVANAAIAEFQLQLLKQLGE